MSPDVAKALGLNDPAALHTRIGPAIQKIGDAIVAAARNNGDEILIVGFLINRILLKSDKAKSQRDLLKLLLELGTTNTALIKEMEQKAEELLTTLETIVAMAEQPEKEAMN